MVFKNVIQVYCRTLSARIRRIKQTGATAGSFASEDIKVACAIIGTLEYVDFTLPQLCDSFKGHILADFHDQLDFDSEQEAIGTLTSFIYTDVLVKSCELALDAAIGAISRTAWYNYELGPGGAMAVSQSGFVGQLGTSMLAQFEAIAGFLSKLHYRFFCDKFVQWFIPRFIEEIYKCRKINEMGASQLLLDT